MFYATKYNLKAGDRIIAPLTELGITKHHAIYLGWDENGVEWIIENTKFVGVRLIEANEYFKDVIRIYAIEKFIGNNIARKNAVQKALRLVGKPYRLIEYNCEHFANEIQFSKPESKQVENVFAVMLAIFFFGIITSE